MRTTKFYKVSSIGPIVQYLTNLISDHLNRNEKVLWLLSGGSSKKIEVEVAKRLKTSNVNLKNLTVSLVDERYGPVGHKDSNWQQLIDEGFKLDGAQLHPVLAGKDLKQTVADYSQFMSQALRESDYKMALIGMGSDGHILGIKSRSPATKTNGLICGYKWEDYTRMTPTPKFIPMLDEVVSYIFGEEKHKLLDHLEKDIPGEVFPGQYLKAARKLTIYNDYKGEVL